MRAVEQHPMPPRSPSHRPRRRQRADRRPRHREPRCRPTSRSGTPPSARNAADVTARTPRHASRRRCRDRAARRRSTRVAGLAGGTAASAVSAIAAVGSIGMEPRARPASSLALRYHEQIDIRRQAQTGRSPRARRRRSCGGAAERHADRIVARAHLGGGDLHREARRRARAADSPSPRESCSAGPRRSSKPRSALCQRSTSASRVGRRQRQPDRRLSRGECRASRPSSAASAGKAGAAMRTATGNGSVPAASSTRSRARAARRRWPARGAGRTAGCGPRCRHRRGETDEREERRRT